MSGNRKGRWKISKLWCGFLHKL